MKFKHMKPTRRNLIRAIWKQGRGHTVSLENDPNVWQWLGYALRGTWAVLLKRGFDEDPYDCGIIEAADKGEAVIMATINYHALDGITCMARDIMHGHDWEEVIVWGWRYSIVANGDN